MHMHISLVLVSTRPSLDYYARTPDIQLKDFCCSCEDFKDAKDPSNKDAQFKKLDVRSSCEAMIRF